MKRRDTAWLGVRWAGSLGLAAALAVAQAPAPLRVAGLVQRDDGGQVEGARITVTGLAHPELPPNVACALGDGASVAVEGACDAKGVFKLVLPHAGPFALLAVSRDGKCARQVFPVMATDFVTLTLRPWCTVEGAVVGASGDPVPGATVYGTSYSAVGSVRERFAWHPVLPKTTADEKGRFVLRLPSGTPGTWAVARSLQATTLTHRFRDRPYRIDGQSLREVLLQAPGPTSDNVRVVDAATGTPIASADVFDLGVSCGRARTGPDGRCEYQLENGLLSDTVDAWPIVRAPGYAVQAWGRGKVQCALVPGAVVRARIVTPGADHSGRCRVLLATRDRETLSYHFAWQTETDADGRLEVREARSGELLYAFVEVEGHFVAGFHVVPSNAPLDLGNVVVGWGRTVTGTVYGHDATRLGGAMVLLQPRLRRVDVSPPPDGIGPEVLSRVTYTDRAGRFRFEGVPATEQWLAVAAGVDGLRVLALDARTIDLGDVAMGGGETATCTVTLPDGSAARDASVQFLSSADGSGSRFGWIYCFGCTDSSGRFVIRGMPAGVVVTGWAMCARDGAGFIASYTVGAGRTVTIPLHPHDGRL
ncbi:MAG: hypothetical protein R3F56_11800 [Planctomycetota bacterium]